MASAGKDRLSSYSVVKAIGKGSYGEVFLVRHSRERKQVSHQLARRQISNSPFFGRMFSKLIHPPSSFLPSFLAQFVMKNIKLTAASAKERLAAEQEVRHGGPIYLLSSTCMSALPSLSPPLTCAGISTVSATTPKHCLLQGVLSRPTR